MVTTTTRTIKELGIPGIALFFGLIGFVWGFLVGLIMFASYVQGYMENGDASLIQPGLLAFGLMVAYGIIGGVVGGAFVAFLYNRVLGAKHGIRMELDTKI